MTHILALAFCAAALAWGVRALRDVVCDLWNCDATWLEEDA